MTTVHTETLRQFYERTRQEMPGELEQGDHVSHFNVKRRLCATRVTPYNRRDYYKICLHLQAGRRIRGIYRENGSETPVDQPCIIYSNPGIPASWESLTDKQDGYVCLFNNAFIPGSLPPELKYGSSLFNPEAPSLVLLDDKDVDRFTWYFTRMEELLAGDYPYRSDMIRHILLLLIHEGVRISQAFTRRAVPGADRLVTSFLELLERQFPVDSPENPFRLKTPSQYATLLNVHVNHLNAMVKKNTGKTTREVIQDRMMDEARKLLLHTSWDAAEIAYSLGFEYPSHFTKFFRQRSGVTPVGFRLQHKTAAGAYL
ncbi:helix-turn-helix domain-containing protein [Chitinophaga japonensis]|uniref:AraC-like DNA-binding protein n=1 Tax=Chitinophaga japonensis TaxID=104662 RepID=A0A562T090_CHIJA|nr:helix-turn-helix domain-containing protein [Chitinophaga japonensis]TWI86773.1 AraC-like DNA-binding protein [Chitinophaga japonensis]